MEAARRGWAEGTAKAAVSKVVAAALISTSSGNLAELAYTERKWELAGEFKRWDDLTRMERVAEALANRSPEELVGPVTGDTSPANYFAEIPEEELIRSPQLRE